MEPTEMPNAQTNLAEAYEYLIKAFALMVVVNNEKRARELSTAITELETAMMWLNKDRAIKGFLAKSDTHVEVANA